MKKVAVIGGGPSGMMAAYCAAKNNDVTLFEKNEKLGKKLFITGKGRCNLTNYRDISEYFDEIVRNGKFLYSALYSMSNYDTLELFEKYGLKYKIERGNRVFPNSDKSSDVIKTYEKMLKDVDVEIKLNTKVDSILNSKIGFILDYNNTRKNFDAVIIATGGISYAATGSTGDGYKFARDLGLKVEDLYPGLVPIELKDDFLEELQGITLKNVTLKTVRNKKILHEEFGDLLFAHFGITGPIVLRTSSYINRLEDFKLFLDLKPALNFEKLENRLLRDFEKNINKEIKNSLIDLLPKKFIPIILDISKVKSNKFVNEITKEERHRLVNSIKNMPLTFKGLLNINAAIVTSGGISIRELNPSTLESKKVPNLYFCGEVLDVDALTGGFNIQIANSTGYLAGNSV
ncbi:NAD(P)/FAD-dependent oxidoreductase [Anaerosphaera multitolerans]|uniref:NAD(P)/FAD-dependent oxidoreductase n=1 Tax=Anaerosphaera multitolerans TaxID=2487351 RepID=A0A437S7M4_9FIRM|nr:NAD(P)/FAD-dependent oxidoreductase [Anaerosphaera multitolerans]RVU54944.1 NAD(P)/FAD-dependent oxidoreductase [Anaerosphaera multitolerans]